MENNVTLLEKIDKFCRDKAMSRSRFGLAALGDPNFVFDLEAGMTISLRRAERVLTYLRENRRMKPLILPVMPRAPLVQPNKGRRKPRAPQADLAAATPAAEQAGEQPPANHAPDPAPLPVSAILSVFA